MLKTIYFVILSTIFCVGCKKGWLDVKSSKSLVVPTSLMDMQALLDNNGSLNTSGSVTAEVFCEIGTDNYFLADAAWENIMGGVNSAHFGRAYAFEEDIFTGVENKLVWNLPYTRVFYANVALEGLRKIKPDVAQEDAYKTAFGSALFVRAHAFFWIAQLFCKPYNHATSETDIGIPLRLSSDINAKSFRASVEKTYGTILEDLKEAASLLQPNAAIVTRPSKTACYALLSRVYMSMRMYDSAFHYANEALVYQNSLLDYNTLNSSLAYPVTQRNPEVIYELTGNAGIFIASTGRVDTTLYFSYHPDDLRKNIFFKPRAGTNYYSFNGSYDGTSRLFTGISTNELYLNRAECYARRNETELALGDLYKLLQNRWRNAAFPGFINIDPNDVLDTILVERRKELCFRGLRWMDLRRLNQEAVFETTVRRVIKDKTYILEPESKRYVYPIPQEVIDATGMQQNNR